MIGERGGMAVSFVVMFIVMSVIFILMLPMALTFNTALWVNSESIAVMGLEEANKIDDEAVREAVTNIYSQNVDGFNIMQRMIAFITMYGWVLIPGMIIVVYILYARQQVETTIV